jgi:hypothetical protein
MLLQSTIHRPIPLEARDLEHSVIKRVGSAIRDLECNLIEDRGLILRGQATSYFAKQTAQEVVMEMTTIPIISNDIRVTVISVEQTGW